MAIRYVSVTTQLATAWVSFRIFLSLCELLNTTHFPKSIGFIHFQEATLHSLLLLLIFLLLVYITNRKNVQICGEFF